MARFSHRMHPDTHALAGMLNACQAQYRDCDDLSWSVTLRNTADWLDFFEAATSR